MVAVSWLNYVLEPTSLVYGSSERPGVAGSHATLPAGATGGTDLPRNEGGFVHYRGIDHDRFSVRRSRSGFVGFVHPLDRRAYPLVFADLEERLPVLRLV
ncbi:hypothetical protein HAPAU_15130 [Halalkalicoccus paucihalophilus]|uniref:Uncharacterized protein n=1 Tax=Halalkalicoccus paucihalophilus TaxID=1008153 RepID=A0A151AFP3_9EURY|nr:hypothetical protein HAPAU_15130 [Halalkalicoccus paucihalophilus]